VIVIALPLRATRISRTDDQSMKRFSAQSHRQPRFAPLSPARPSFTTDSGYHRPPPLIPCPNIKYHQPPLGHVSMSLPTPSVGWFCPAGTVDPYSFACGGPEHYCPEGSGRPLPVAQGYYAGGAAVDLAGDAGGYSFQVRSGRWRAVRFLY